ncbi:MAG: hypothetical protein AAGK02_07215 [Pseudomonadota bacterium]
MPNSPTPVDLDELERLAEKADAAPTGFVQRTHNAGLDNEFEDFRQHKDVERYQRAVLNNADALISRIRELEAREHAYRNFIRGAVYQAENGKIFPAKQDWVDLTDGLSDDEAAVIRATLQEKDQ